MSTTMSMGFDELFAIGDVDAFLSKAEEKCRQKLRGKTFAGMEKEDVTQEVLIKLYRSLDQYDVTKARMSTFVDHLIDNKIKDMYRKCMTEKNLNVVNAIQVISTDLDIDDETGNGVGIALGHEGYAYENFEFVTDIMENMELNDREKKIFKLRSTGYEFVEIADILGVSKARVSQLWKGIREKYEAHLI
ncbi:sigma-70 family RNA polymerase sigma factor [Paenibacillus sp. D2_2]|uniref:sigma-70 family RNA polymerase sigma factor n=1 Tax=Paenibacillus sp. D2_2 TaxID=3073092 RepID=UPI0028157453|nr:sigma-70 family RNA polymerase sigma factor [Paenibacillus sp. D2_2]WMT39260.1 sigma-70 family RNA polymerase sigma factor [Paenibacillus sp. D2_2]